MSVKHYPPTHPYCGSNSERQSVGDPGHCDRCAEIGHVLAHPSLGCGDVGCDRDHGFGNPADTPEWLEATGRADREFDARTALNRRGVILGFGRSFTLDQIEALAEVVKTWED
jgi:hypothetical protein